MKDDIGTIIKDQFTKLLKQNVDRNIILGAEGQELRTELWAAIENAASVAAMVLTTESLITDVKEDAPAGPVPPPMDY